jgi:HK97 family phage prohead protease
MQIERKILDFSLKASSGDGSTFEGYANAFNNIDAVGEIVMPGAFADTLDQFLSVGFIGGLNHNWDCPIGKPLAAEEDVKGLFVKGKISATEHGKDCMILLKDDVIKKMSIGYRVKGAEYLDTAEDVANYWKEQNYAPSPEDIAAAQYGARLLTKLMLYEFSPVTVPANLLADITGVKNLDFSEIKTVRDLENYLLRDAKIRFKDAKALIACMKAVLLRDVETEQTPETPSVAEAPIVMTEAVKEVSVLIEKADPGAVRALYAQFLNHEAARYMPR